MNEEKIKELFELCLRVSNETTKHVEFDYIVNGDMSVVYIYIFNDSRVIIKHFSLSQFYDFKHESQNYENAKNVFWNCLSMGGVR